ncbi:hypothetical protein [Polaromonas sp.]|uniref:hypothetical protein n=1 Tax=Polaromonas sp. TaxID=1869339 RepID=UPI003BB6BE85
MDKSGANKAAMDEINARGETPVPVIVRQDHRAVKRVTKPMLNFKLFQAAKSVLVGIEFLVSVLVDSRIGRAVYYTCLQEVKTDTVMPADFTKTRCPIPLPC